MAIYANAPERREQSGDFPVPPEGEQQAVCADVEDLGMKPILWRGIAKNKPRIALFFLSSFKDATGKPISIREEFTRSLWETARLRKFLGKWRGKPLSDEECQKFDLETLIGVNAMITVSLNRTPKRTYANIEAIRPYTGDIKLYVPVDYVRKKDRKQQQPDEYRYQHSDNDDWDESVPF